MQGTIIYLISQEAQRKAILATGQPVPAKQVRSVEITADNAKYFDIQPDGSAVLDLTQAGVMAKFNDELKAAGCVSADPKLQFPVQPRLLPDIDTDVLALIAAGESKIKAERDQEAKLKSEREAKEKEQKRVATQAVLDQRKIKTGNDSEYRDGKTIRWVTVSPDWPYCLDGEIVDSAEARAWREELADANAKAKAAAIAKYESDKAQAEAKEAAKDAHIAEWAKKQGGEILQQFDDFLLDRSEALKLIADEAFAAANLPDKYSPRICKETACPCGRNDIETLPRRYYRAYAAIKKGVPKGTVLEPEKVIECLSGDGELMSDEDAVTRYAVLVKLPVGPFVFERLIRLHELA